MDITQVPTKKATTFGPVRNAVRTGNKRSTILRGRSAC